MNAYAEASKLLGHAFVSPDTVMRLTDFPAYTMEQRRHLVNTLPKREILIKLDRLSCMLVPSPSVILTLRMLRGSSLARHFYQSKNPWYLEHVEDFQDIESLTPATWYAMKRSKVLEARMQSWASQCRTIAPMGLVPAPAVLVLYSVFLYLEVHGKANLFREIELRTASLSSNGMNVSIGPFIKDGMPVKRSALAERRNDLNIATHYPLGG